MSISLCINELYGTMPLCELLRHRSNCCKKTIKIVVDSDMFNNILLDYFNEFPMDELRTAYKKMPCKKFSNSNSIAGRVICLWKFIYHLMAIVLKPLLYLFISFFFLCPGDFKNAKRREIENRLEANVWGVYLVLTAIVTPIGQTIQVFKAFLGIFHPGFYFK